MTPITNVKATSSLRNPLADGIGRDGDATIIHPMTDEQTDFRPGQARTARRAIVTPPTDPTYAYQWTVGGSPVTVRPMRKISEAEANDDSYMIGFAVVDAGGGDDGKVRFYKSTDGETATLLGMTTEVIASTTSSHPTDVVAISETRWLALCQFDALPDNLDGRLYLIEDNGDGTVSHTLCPVTAYDGETALNVSGNRLVGFLSGYGTGVWQNSSGTILMGLYNGRSSSNHTIEVYRSDDDGASWTVIQEIADLSGGTTRSHTHSMMYHEGLDLWACNRGDGSNGGLWVGDGTKDSLSRVWKSGAVDPSYVYDYGHPTKLLIGPHSGSHTVAESLATLDLSSYEYEQVHLGELITNRDGFGSLWRYGGFLYAAQHTMDAEGSADYSKGQVVYVGSSPASMAGWLQMPETDHTEDPGISATVTNIERALFAGMVGGKFLLNVFQGDGWVLVSPPNPVEVDAPILTGASENLFTDGNMQSDTPDDGNLGPFYDLDDEGEISTDYAHSGTQSAKCSDVSSSGCTAKTFNSAAAGGVGNGLSMSGLATSRIHASMWVYLATTDSRLDAGYIPCYIYGYDTTADSGAGDWVRLESASGTTLFGPVTTYRLNARQPINTWQQIKWPSFIPGSNVTHIGFKVGGGFPNDGDTVYIDDIEVYTDVPDVYVGTGSKARDEYPVRIDAGDAWTNILGFQPEVIGDELGADVYPCTWIIDSNNFFTVWYDVSEKKWTISSTKGGASETDVVHDASYLGHRVQCWLAVNVYDDGGTTTAKVWMSVGGHDFETTAADQDSGWVELGTIEVADGFLNGSFDRQLGDDSRASQLPMTLTGDWLVRGSWDYADLNAELPGLVRSLDDPAVAGRRWMFR